MNDPCKKKENCSNLICLHRGKHTHTVSCEEFCEDKKNTKCGAYLTEGKKWETS
jgi:hypothetical protein